MSAPNLNSSSMIANGAVDRITPNSTAEQSLTTNAAASGHTYITLSLTCANTTTSGIAVRTNWFDGTNNNPIIQDAVVPGNAQMEITPTRKFLLENWTLKITTPNTTAGITFTHHYVDSH